MASRKGGLLTAIARDLECAAKQQQREAERAGKLIVDHLDDPELLSILMKWDGVKE